MRLRGCARATIKAARRRPRRKTADKEPSSRQRQGGTDPGQNDARFLRHTENGSPTPTWCTHRNSTNVVAALTRPKTWEERNMLRFTIGKLPAIGMFGGLLLLAIGPVEAAPTTTPDTTTMGVPLDLSPVDPPNR